MNLNAIYNISTFLRSQVAERVEDRGKMIVTIFSSGGERYMSAQLFDEVREECSTMSFE